MPSLTTPRHRSAQGDVILNPPVVEKRPLYLKWVGGLLLLGLIVGGTAWRLRTADGKSSFSHDANGTHSTEQEQPAALRVQVARVQRGGMDRYTVQPGSVRAFESAELFAKVSGYVKTLNVDIGSPVKVGQLLVELYQPELAKDVERHEAAVQQAQARIVQMEARVRTAQADHQAALAAIEQAEAEVGRSEATLSFRQKQYLRIKSLFELKSIDERLVDEKHDERDAAAAAKEVAIAHIATTKAQAAATQAKIEQSRADVKDAEAAARLAQAELERAQVMLAYTHITSPYDGVVTVRNIHVGDFIRDAEQGAQQRPMLVVQKTDIMRVVVDVPDRDVPFLDVDDPATVELDPLPGREFPGKVARKAHSEDPLTRTMRTEVDLENKDGRLSDGMYGRVRILLHPRIERHFTIPSACLTTAPEGGKTSVLVVKDGRIRRTPVTVTIDTGSFAEVAKGLSGDELIVVAPSAALVEGTPVEPVTQAGAEKPAAGH
ncbi:MAG TPA: efflux RND transporter periplasmic adaptor subunit [Planctomycetaceae bacterium]|nr:efflux RND transporter periplasmic adaptor subunit [Planctomycetaceae bacterium]